eukprot:6212425-Pleurochrysis_carterae.AAC.9
MRVRVRACVRACVCVRACACVCVRVRAFACVRVRVRARMRVRACVRPPAKPMTHVAPMSDALSPSGCGCMSACMPWPTETAQPKNMMPTALTRLHTYCSAW